MGGPNAIDVRATHDPDEPSKSNVEAVLTLVPQDRLMPGVSDQLTVTSIFLPPSSATGAGTVMVSTPLSR